MANLLTGIVMCDAWSSRTITFGLPSILAVVDELPAELAKKVEEDRFLRHGRVGNYACRAWHALVGCNLVSLKTLPLENDQWRYRLACGIYRGDDDGINAVVQLFWSQPPSGLFLPSLVRA